LVRSHRRRHSKVTNCVGSANENRSPVSLNYGQKDPKLFRKDLGSLDERLYKGPRHPLFERIRLLEFRNDFDCSFQLRIISFAGGFWIEWL
jgi:hypothetical protein